MAESPEEGSVTATATATAVSEATTSIGASNLNPAFNTDPNSLNDTEEVERPSKRCKVKKNDDDQRTCEGCGLNKPRSKYNKKQWAKVYGNGTCLQCSHASRRQAQAQEQQELKQRQHDQKLADQRAKKEGTFMEARPCMQCQTDKRRTEYSGKQWKKLFRQCQNCVETKGLQKVLLVGETESAVNNTNGSRYCSGCKETKLVEHYTADQWRQSVDAERLCKTCFVEEGDAKRQHRQLTEAQCDDKLKRCFACHEFLEVTTKFSQKQQQKPYGMCIHCVEIIQADRKKDNARARESATRACSLCHTHKTIGNFGKGQWKRSDPRCRPCAMDLVQRQDLHRAEEKKNNGDSEEGNDNENENDTNRSDNPKTRRCFECGQFGEKQQYSGRQWTKTYPSCIECARKVSSNNKQELLDADEVVGDEEGAKEETTTAKEEEQEKEA